MSASSEPSDTSKTPSPHIPLPQIARPTLQREYTPSPSQRQDCTPYTSHGFIAMHTSTPIEEPHHTWSNGKSAYTGDYFSVRKQSRMCSPDHAPYEPHGFLPPCSVAAVKEDANDCFAHTSDAPAEPMVSGHDADTVAHYIVEDVECKSVPTQQFEDYMHMSHLPLSELAHPIGSPVGEHDIVPEPEDDQHTRRKPEIGFRGENNKELYERESGTCAHSCTGSASRYVKWAPAHDERRRRILSSDDDAPYQAKASREDTTEERKFLPALNKKIEQVLRATLVVRRRALEAVTPNDMSTSKQQDPNKTSEHDEYMTESQQPRDGFGPFQSESAVLSDGASAQSEIKVTSIDTQPHNTSPNISLEEKGTPKGSISPIASPAGRRRKRMTLSNRERLGGDSGRLFNIVQRTNPRVLIALKSGFTVDLVNGTSKEIYIHNVSLRMLWHFCGISALGRFVPEKNERSSMLKIPAEEAEKFGIARVVRYMRRACKAASVKPAGELRVPPSLAAGIETIRACRMFGLEADAMRIEDMIIDEWMQKKAWYMTDEHVEMIWDSYHGSLRETVFGDAIVWFVLTEVQSKSHPLAEEIRWMLDQVDYETLKARVTSEVQRKKWRQEDRDRFLGRCRKERSENVC